MNSHPCESRKALRAAGRSPNLALQMNSTAQINAIKAKGNVLVVAGAGTGKTSTLVGRTLHLLENGGSIERILMVTFTEAAATEMRTRIRQALESRIAALEIAGDAELQQHFQKQLALLDTALISTLHGFCLQLIREHFYELELDPEISVLDETQTHPMIEQLLGAIFEAHYAGKTGNAAEVQKLIRVQGRGSDERIREFILKLHRYTQSLANPAKWLRDQKAIFSSPEPVQWRQWFIEGFVEWRKLWVPALKEFSETPAVALVIAALEKNPTKTDLPEISRALGAIFEAD
ncbi:MAG TPA: UvrD-helicase domain-containing protein, partial [Verrucomicrobiae bacterium]|nr:UvrD-helicase domain-containing protein [Verrucomicrobiae bacterium]